MPLQPTETDLVGQWIPTDTGAVGDAVSARINALIKHHLQEIAVSPESGGWEVLYKDSGDGRLWELTYPHGELQGGGPKRLTNISAETAAAKYRLNI